MDYEWLYFVLIVIGGIVMFLLLVFYIMPKGVDLYEYYYSKKPKQATS
jgi:hypothetical protein